MSAAARFAASVDDRLVAVLDERTASAARLADDLTAFIAASRSLLAGGKRLRAVFLYWGWQSVVAGRDDATHLSGTERDEGWAHAVEMATALELFHAAALVHDDLIDDSDTRRGNPSAHRALQGLHASSDWAGDGEKWGRNAAILLGDLLLNWADDVMVELAWSLGTAGKSVLDVYRRMRQEVTLGQYLDVLEEAAWIRQEPDALLARAHRVALSKSARYSVQEPLLLGATLAGASDEQSRGLAAYGERVGFAYQMRDDILGVFGDPATTGKPAGDDLREGKRTVLVELARGRMAPNVRVLLDELLGDPDLDEVQVRMLQEAIRASGAAERLDVTIDKAIGGALEALRDIGISRSAELELERLGVLVANRDS